MPKSDTIIGSRKWILYKIFWSNSQINYCVSCMIYCLKSAEYVVVRCVHESLYIVQMREVMHPNNIRKWKNEIVYSFGVASMLVSVNFDVKITYKNICVVNQHRYRVRIHRCTSYDEVRLWLYFFCWPVLSWSITILNISDGLKWQEIVIYKNKSSL